MEGRKRLNCMPLPQHCCSCIAPWTAHPAPFESVTPAVGLGGSTMQHHNSHHQTIEINVATDHPCLEKYVIAYLIMKTSFTQTTFTVTISAMIITGRINREFEQITAGSPMVGTPITKSEV